MAVNIERRWCDVCQADVKAERHSVNHILHLLLACVTFGVWIPIWFLLAVNRSYRCTVCGSRARVKLDPLTVAFIAVPALVFMFFMSFQESEDAQRAKALARQQSYVVSQRAVIYDAPNVPLPGSFAREGQRLPAIAESRDGFSKFVDVEASGRKQTFWLRDADFEAVAKRATDEE